MNLNFFKKQEPQKAPEMNESNFQSFSIKTPELPTIIEKNNQDYISYGLDNMYPSSLNNLVKQSAMQSAIIRTKAKMMSGSAFLINGAKDEIDSENIFKTLDPKTQKDLNNFFENNGDDLNDIKLKMSDDFQRYGAMCAEIIYSMDWSRIAKIKYIQVANIRSGKMINGKVEKYYYSKNWADRRETPIEIYAYDEDDKTHYNQLIYIKQGNLDYYGEPSYESCLKWVAIDAKLGRFHDSAISKNFNMGMSITIYGAPADEAKREGIVRNLKRQYEGEDNAGKTAVFFADSKDTATEVKPIEVSNLDKNLLVLSDQCVSHILTANSATTPLLFGITTAGQLGGNTELETGYKIFNKMVVQPDREILERFFNKILKHNNVPVTVKLQEFNPTI